MDYKPLGLGPIKEWRSPMEGILNVLLSGKLGIKPVFFPGENKTQDHLAPNFVGSYILRTHMSLNPKDSVPGLTFPVWATTSRPCAPTNLGCHFSPTLPPPLAVCLGGSALLPCLQCPPLLPVTLRSYSFFKWLLPGASLTASTRCSISFTAAPFALAFACLLFTWHLTMYCICQLVFLYLIHCNCISWYLP